MEVEEITSITKLKALRDKKRAQVLSTEEQKKAHFVHMLREMPEVAPNEVIRTVAKKIYEEIKRS